MNAFFNLIALIAVIVMLVFCIYLFRLDMLPFKYLSILYLFIGFIYLILLGLTLPRRIKYRIKSICLVLFVLFSSVFIFGIKYVDKTIEFMDVINNELSQKEEYHVSVSYEQVDVFQRFTELVPTEKARIEQKVQNGEYKGTLEEINQQMQDEYLVNCYELFKKAFEEMQVTEKGSMVFVVKENEDGLFGIDDSLRTELIIKIMGLDENQD